MNKLRKTNRILTRATNRNPWNKFHEVASRGLLALTVCGFLLTGCKTTAPIIQTQRPVSGEVIPKPVPEEKPIENPTVQEPKKQQDVPPLVYRAPLTERDKELLRILSLSIAPSGNGNIGLGAYAVEEGRRVMFSERIPRDAFTEFSTTEGSRWKSVTALFSNDPIMHRGAIYLLYSANTDLDREILRWFVKDPTAPPEARLFAFDYAIPYSRWSGRNRAT